MLVLEKRLSLSTVIVGGWLAITVLTETSSLLLSSPDWDVEVVLASKEHHTVINVEVLPAVPKGWDSVEA